MSVRLPLFVVALFLGVGIGVRAAELSITAFGIVTNAVHLTVEWPEESPLPDDAFDVFYTDDLVAGRWRMLSRVLVDPATNARPLAFSAPGIASSPSAFFTVGTLLDNITRADITHNALANIAYAVDSRLAGKGPAAALPLTMEFRLAGKDPAIALPLFEDYLANAANGVFIRNTNCWAYGLDLTCASPWRESFGDWYGQNMAGTLVSPRHIILAAHFDRIAIGAKITFVDMHNNVVERTLVAKKRHSGYSGDPWYFYDLTVGLLDSDVPTNQISFVKVLPDNYADYIVTGAHLPVVCSNQKKEALVKDVSALSVFWEDSPPDGSQNVVVHTPENPVRKAFDREVIAGDSGSPVFLIVNNQPVLLTVWTSPEHGTSIHDCKADINAMMEELGGGYQLEEVEMEGFDVVRVWE